MTYFLLDSKGSRKCTFRCQKLGDSADNTNRRFGLTMCHPYGPHSQK